MLMPFFEQEMMGDILEQETDALFIHFINQYKGPFDNLAIDFWVCLKEEEKVVSSTSGDTDEHLRNLHTEFIKSPWLKSRFSSMSQTLFAEMMKKLCTEVTTKLSDKFPENVKKLRKLKITDMQFVEFTKLYFNM